MVFGSLVSAFPKFCQSSLSGDLAIVYSRMQERVWVGVLVIVGAVDCLTLSCLKLKHKAVITFAHLVEMYLPNDPLSLCRNKIICDYLR